MWPSPPAGRPGGRCRGGRLRAPRPRRWPSRATTAPTRRRAPSGGTPPAGWGARNPEPPRLPGDLLPQPHRAGRRFPSRFAARQLMFAHAALTDLGARRHRHDQRIARWGRLRRRPAPPHPRTTQTSCLATGDWPASAPGTTQCRRPTAPKSTAGRLPLARSGTAQRTQPVLLQGDAGFSRKGPRPEPRPATTTASRSWRSPARWPHRRPASRATAAPGWTTSGASQILHADAVGWDWIGINLFDGSALTAFRCAAPTAAHCGPAAAIAPAAASVRAFAPTEVRFAGPPLEQPGHRRRATRWTGTSRRRPARTPSARTARRQELDSRGSTGTVYWEGLSELLDERAAAASVWATWR
jgi:predicted secreted hydrolase